MSQSSDLSSIVIAAAVAIVSLGQACDLAATLAARARAPVPTATDVAHCLAAVAPRVRT